MNTFTFIFFGLCLSFRLEISQAGEGALEHLWKQEGLDAMYGYVRSMGIGQMAFSEPAKNGDHRGFY